MADQLEQVISNLLVPDNNVISQATLQLKDLMKNPAVVPVLCQLFSSSKSEVRQYSAILLRKKLTKKKQWDSINPEIRENIKENIFEILVGEQDQKVRQSLVQLVATICKHELPEGKWPKVFTVFTTLAEKEDLSLKETGMFLMSSIASTAHEELKPHFQGFISLCGAALAEGRNHMIQFHALRALYHILPSVEAGHANQLQSLIESSFTAVRNIASVDEDLAVETMEFFEGSVTCEVPIINPHLKTAITFFVEIGRNQALKSSLRSSALSVLCEMMENKKKAVLKMNIMPALISELFTILCEEEEEDEDDEENTVSSMASQVFSLMALYLPPEKFIPPLMKLIEPAFENANPKIRAGAFVAIGVATEGCSENIKYKHMKKLLKFIYKGMSDENDKVRSAAMFALAEFSEYLQPDINKFSQELLPLLFECLGKISTDENAKRCDLARIYYAIEKFCEHLEKDILPYLPQLMEFLITSAKNSHSYDVKELSVSTIGAAAASANEAVLPYMPHILELLKGFLQPTTEEGPLKVQIQSLSTLSTLLRNSGEKNETLVMESFMMAFNLIDQADDPELRGAIYRIFGTCWIILKDKLNAHVTDVYKMFIGCMKSNEGISATFHDDDAKHLSEIFDDEEEEEDLGEEDDVESLLGNNVSISLQNSYMNEKIDAIIALGELASGSGVAFLPFFEESFKECLDLLIYPDTNIISSAASCATDLCCSAYNLTKSNPELIGNVTSGLNMMLNATVPKLLEVVREDLEREVVISVLEYLKKLIDTIGMPVLHAASSPSMFFSLVKDVIKRKVKCQGEVDEDDEDEAEYDTLLIESAGEIIPALAAVAPNNEFVAFYNGMIPELMKKLKPSSTVSDRSFAIGNMAETMHKLGKAGGIFAMKLYPLMMNGLKDEDEEVRNNSIYGLGILAEVGGTPILNHYNEMLKVLSETLARETNRMVIDNICGAVCRMITTNPAAVPVGQVLSSIINYLPLQVDLQENPTVFQCFMSLYSQKSLDVIQLLPKILTVAAALLSTKITSEFKAELVAFVHEVSGNNPEAFSSMDEQTIQFLRGSMQNGFN